MTMIARFRENSFSQIGKITLKLSPESACQYWYPRWFFASLRKGAVKNFFYASAFFAPSDSWSQTRARSVSINNTNLNFRFRKRLDQLQRPKIICISFPQHLLTRRQNRKSFKRLRNEIACRMILAVCLETNTPMSSPPFYDDPVYLRSDSCSQSRITPQSTCDEHPPIPAPMAPDAVSTYNHELL